MATTSASNTSSVLNSDRKITYDTLTMSTSNSYEVLLDIDEGDEQYILRQISTNLYTHESSRTAKKPLAIYVYLQNTANILRTITSVTKNLMSVKMNLDYDTVHTMGRTSSD